MTPIDCEAKAGPVPAFVISGSGSSAAVETLPDLVLTARELAPAAAMPRTAPLLGPHPAAAGRIERRRGRALPGGDPDPQKPYRADHGLCRRTARVGSRSPEDCRHRQQADGDPGRAGQGRQGPLRHALSAAAEDFTYWGAMAVSRP